MSCCVGEKKLGRVACPDPWKSGARNTVGRSAPIISLVSYPHIPRLHDKEYNYCIPHVDLGDVMV